VNLRVHWLVILLALALAWPLRTRSGAGNVVEPGELYGVAALFSDGESYLHARRVSCALEGAGVGSRDGLLGHPQAAEIVAPPLYDAARTALVQLRVERTDEPGRERFLAGLGPGIGALVCFLVWLAARAAGAGAFESVLAALWVAVAPACVRADEWGRLSDIALGLVPLALAVFFALRGLGADEPLRAILGGLSAGAFAGLLLASSPAGSVVFLAGVAGFALFTFSASGDTARFAARAGLLYCLVAAIVARMLVLDGPWQAEPGGLFAAWVEVASVLAFACSAPFLVAMARDQIATRRIFPALVMLAAGVMIALLVVRVAGPGARVFAAWAQARELRPLFGAPGLWPALLGLTPLVLLVPVGWSALARRGLDARGLYLLVLSAGALVATLLDPALAPWCVAASALLLAHVATGWGAGTRERRWALGVGAAVLAAHALAGFLARPDMALHETRVEIARGLRWMRENTPSPGPWNAPRARPDWGVLALPARGAEIAWQARRPALASEAGAHGAPAPLLAALQALQARSGDALLRAMRSCSARYLVTTPLDGQPEIPLEWGLQRVYASRRMIDAAGRAAAGSSIVGPALSIWELPRPAAEDSGPQMRAR
jgi:hypothetical protein